MVKVGHSRLFPKNKFGFHILLLEIRRKKQSPTVWEIKRGSFCSQIEKDHIYYKRFQIKKKIFIIGNSCCHFVRGLAKKCHEGFFVFLIFGPTMLGWPWESLELGKGVFFLFKKKKLVWDGQRWEPCSFSLFS